MAKLPLFEVFPNLPNTEVIEVIVTEIQLICLNPNQILLGFVLFCFFFLGSSWLVGTVTIAWGLEWTLGFGVDSQFKTNFHWSNHLKKFLK